MNAPGSPRFRFRTPDGTEVPVVSVEELSSRLERGELGTETPLFDAGTGTWNRAGDVPVFQFVREELRAEGRLPDDDDAEMVVLPEPPPEGPIDPGVEFEPIDHGGETDAGSGSGSGSGGFRPLASPTVDPFELHLPLSNPLDPLEDARGPAPPDASAGDAASEASALEEDDAAGPDREPWFEDRQEDDSTEPEETGPAEDPESGSDPGLEIDSSPLHAWLSQGPGSGREASGVEADTGTGRGGEPPAPPAPPPLTASPPAAAAEPSLSSAPVAIRTAWEDHDAGEDPRAVRLRSRRRQRNARLMAGLAALVIVGVGGVAIYTTVQAPNAGTSAGGDPQVPAPGSGGPGLPGPASPSGVEGVDLPEHLEGRAAEIWAALPGEVSLLVDSLRSEAGLDDAPPRAWLGGYYLANAGEFPEVVAFWETYGSFVGGLASRDAGLFRQAGERIMDRMEAGAGGTGAAADAAPLAAAEREEILQALEERHGQADGARQDRYLHLQRTAEAALDLHAFLVSNEGSISYSPALGQGVSVDPVLEAVTDTPEIRRQMEQNLDRIFAALDRTRGGGQPSLAGLRSELFGSLGRPF